MAFVAGYNLQVGRFQPVSCNVSPAGAYMEFENPETAVLDHQESYRGKILPAVDTIRQARVKHHPRVILHPGGVTAVCFG